MTRHMLGLFPGRPGARLYRQRLSTLAPQRSAGLAVLREAVGAIGRETLIAAGSEGVPSPRERGRLG